MAQSLRSVAVAPIEGRAGWLVRTALEDRLGGAGGRRRRYRLEVLLDDDITGFGIRSDDAVTRERRTLRARYRLVDAARGTVCSTPPPAPTPASTWSAPNMRRSRPSRPRSSGSPKEIADQIVTRVALYARRSGGAR